MNDGFKRKLEEQRDKLKQQLRDEFAKNPQAKEQLRRNGVISAAFWGAAMGGMITRHPLGLVAGGIVGGVAGRKAVEEVLNELDGISPATSRPASQPKPRKPSGNDMPDPFAGLGEDKGAKKEPMPNPFEGLDSGNDNSDDSENKPAKPKKSGGGKKRGGPSPS